MRRWWLPLAMALTLPVVVLLPAGHLRRASGASRPPEVRRLGGRILVLAPHPDDEVVGAGGAIATALRAGDQVWVAVATSGESSTPAAMRTLHVAHPTAADFARLGRIRRGESRAGTRILGLPPSHLIFLGYADGSLTPLWLGAWDCRHPRVSGGTHVARSLLADGFDPHVAYCAPNLLGDLERLFLQVRPDVIILPDPADHHPDHAALADFAWAAVMAYDRNRPAGAPEPQLYGYLVHYPDWPRPWGRAPAEEEAFPSPWTGGPVSVVRLPLAPAVTSLEGRALLQYRSQLAVSPEFLGSFVRQDELFTRRPLVLPLGADWMTLGEVRGLGVAYRVVRRRGVPEVVRVSRYAGAATTFWARSPEPGRIELRLGAGDWPRGVILRLYAWQVRPGGPNERLELVWSDGRGLLIRNGVESDLRPDWTRTGRDLTWSFEAGSGPWQVAASVAYGGRQVGWTPWLGVSAGPGTALRGWGRPGSVGPGDLPEESGGREKVWALLVHDALRHVA